MKRLSFARLSYAALLLLSPLVSTSALLAQDGGGGAAAAPAAVAAPAAPAAASSGSSGAAGAGAASVSSGAAPATSSTTTTAPAAAALTPNAGESDASFLQRVMAAKSGTDPGADDQDDTPFNDDANLADPGEATEAETPGEEKPAQEEAPGSGDGDDDFDPYAPTSVLLAPKELAAKLQANPALMAALESDPDLKQTLLDQSRAAAESTEFKQVFQNAAEAKTAAAGNQEYTKLSTLVTSIEKPEDAQGFYAHLLQLSVLHDDDGNPLMQDGKPVSDGTVGKLIHHTGALFLNHFESLAKAGEGDDELAAAVEIVRERAFGKKDGASNPYLTDEQRAREEALDTREKSINDRAQAAATEARQQYESAITTAIDSTADTAITSLLGRTDLSAEQRTELSGKIRAAAYDLIVENPQFQLEQDALMRRAMGPKTKDARVALGKQWLQRVLPRVAPKLIADAGAKILARQKKSFEKQAERVAASRSEGAGALRTAKPVGTTSAADLTTKVISDFKATHGREPNAGEIFDGVMKARSQK